MCANINNAFELIRNKIALKRPTIQNLDERLFPKDHPMPKSLIEISGANGCGKTQILHYIMSLCVLPADFGGKQGHVICIDLKKKFDPEVFLGQIENIIRQKVENGTGVGNTFNESELDAEHIKQIGLNCLKAITIIYCYSADEFALTLDDVQNMLMDDKNGDIILLALDGLDAFYWIENFERKRRMRTHYAQHTEHLRAICVANDISCAFTADTNYVETKFVNELTFLSDYRLVLSWKPGTERTLNGLSIDINKNGLQFFSKQ